MSVIEMPRMKDAIELLLPLKSDEIDCDGLSEGFSLGYVYSVFSIHVHIGRHG